VIFSKFMKSLILTSIQYLCLAWILYTNPWLTAHSILVVIQVAGLVLGIWSIVEMSKSKLNITPVPREGAILIASGPYKLIRHPMYMALILSLFPMLAMDHGIVNLLVFGVFLCNMIFKLSYEEQLLHNRFPEYGEMAFRSWRLIPWIY